MLRGSHTLRGTDQRNGLLYGSGTEKGRIEKAFTVGTHRALAPPKLLAELEIDLPRYGITRTARLTDLDRIGIEVFAVIRPNSRGLSVAQGKGCTHDAARLSGIMEAIELWHAENPALPLAFGAHDTMPKALPRSVLDRLLGQPLGDAPIYWCHGVDLLTGQPVTIPFDLVHACFTEDAQVRGAKFPVSTNGLASGANREEALIHALCEVIERHDTATLARLDPSDRAECVLDLDTVTDDAASALLDRLRHADMAVRVWNSTGDCGVASFVAAIADLRDSWAPAGFGAGCHPCSAIALCRALTEAAQARLTRISGARDDLVSDQFGRAAGLRARWLTEPSADTPCCFADVPDLATEYLDADLHVVLEALAAAGCPIVAAFDLSSNQRFSVVRVVVPGLLGFEVAR